MKLENQVTNLELSKKLKELGVEQNSYFYYWGRNKDILSFKHGAYRLQAVNEGDFTLMPESAELVSAFTVAELGEMLPSWIENLHELTIHHLSIGWNVEYVSRNDELYREFAQDTLVDAMAKMLIYLIENKLINI